MRPPRFKGNSHTEYLVGLMALVLALMMPIKDGDNVVELLADAIKQEHAAYMHAISLPL